MGLLNRLVPALLTLAFVASCAQKVEKSEEFQPKEEARQENSKTNTVVSVLPPPPPPIMAPTHFEISPFEGKTFTMSAVDAPLVKVLYAIAKDAGLNLVVSPEVNLNRTITANFEDVPLENALEIIMDMTGLHYEVRGNVLYVKEFLTKTFKVPYVNTKTKFSSSLGGDVLGGALSAATTGTGGASGGLGGGFGGAGGTSSLKGEFSLDYEVPENSKDFYTQLEENLKKFLSKEGKLVLNRFTGTVTVTDRKRNVERIEEFLKTVNREVKRQVLIEAKIVEIALSDSYQYGIDWSAFFRDVLGTGANVTISQTLSIPTGGAASLSVVSTDFTSLINALATYGKVYTLSNPRILVSNGQTALIATGIVTPFFERQVLTVTGTATTQLQESIIKTNVLEGVLLGVTPHIDEGGNVVLNIVPVSTRLEGTKTLEIEGQVVAEAPILNIKEAGTVIRVRDGELVVIGGLIGNTREVQERKVPGLGDLPVLGYLFKNRKVVKEKRELIIFLKPKIVEDLRL